MAFLAVLVLFYLSSFGHLLEVIKYKKLKLIHNNPVLVTQGTSFHCAEHCYCLDICKSYNYDRKRRLCIILDVLASMVDTEDNNDYMYMEKQQIPSALGKSCQECFKAEKPYKSVLPQLEIQFQRKSLDIARHNGIILEAESFSSEVSEIIENDFASNGKALQVVSGDMLQIVINVIRPVQFDIDIRYSAKTLGISYIVFLNKLKMWSGKFNNQGDVFVTAKVSDDTTFVGRGRYLIELLLGTDDEFVGVDLDNLMIYCYPLFGLDKTDRSSCGFTVEETNVVVVYNRTDLNDIQVQKSYLIEAEDFEATPVASTRRRQDASGKKAVHLFPGENIKQPVCVKGTAKLVMNFASLSNDGCADRIVIRLQSMEIGHMETENIQEHGRVWGAYYNKMVGNSMILNAGETLLDIVPVVIDKYGVEIDLIDIDVVTISDGDFNIGSCG